MEETKKKPMKSKFTLISGLTYRGVFVRYPNGFAFIPFGCFVRGNSIIPVMCKLQDDDGFAKFRDNLIRATFRHGKNQGVSGQYHMDYIGTFDAIHDAKESLDQSHNLPGVLQSEILEWESSRILEKAA